MGTPIFVSHDGEITTHRCNFEDHKGAVEAGGFRSFAHIFIPDEAPAPEAALPPCKNQQWSRSSGHSVCRCGRPYSEHVGLNLLCDGTLVKL